MATKKNKKKSSSRKKATTKKVTKAAARNKTAKKVSAKKKSATRKKSSAKSTAKKKASFKKAAKKAPARKKLPARQSQSFDTDAIELQHRRSRAAGQSGDLQGLSGSEGADSESVDELLEEGNTFEAGVVEGVEEAGDDEEKEIHTHEVSEDDVPDEYLNQD